MKADKSNSILKIRLFLWEDWGNETKRVSFLLHVIFQRKGGLGTMKEIQDPIYKNSRIKILAWILFAGFLYTSPNVFLLAMLLFIGALVALYRIGQIKEKYSRKDWMKDIAILLVILVIILFVLFPIVTNTFGYELSMTDEFIPFGNSYRRRREYLFTIIPLWLFWVLAFYIKDRENAKWKIRALFFSS